MVIPRSLQRSISPPPIRRTSQQANRTASNIEHNITNTQDTAAARTLAAIEAGEVIIRDHLDYLAAHLQAIERPTTIDSLRLPIAAWKDLYLRNQHPRGRHFVVHQHDHPISGVHYDLRLQFSEDSSISFAIPYGLPGNPNSLRPMRMAIETRVHCLWNHLIESASHTTGSLLIWDTGEYEVIEPLPREKVPETEDEASDISDTSTHNAEHSLSSDSRKLEEAFQKRHIRLRLHGTRLPKGYTVNLRLPSANDTSTRISKSPRRKRRKRAMIVKPQTEEAETTDEETKHPTPSESLIGEHEGLPPAKSESGDADAAATASGDEEDATIRKNNAYPGSTNTIGSVHQRRWLMTLDKQNSGFVKSSTTGEWTRCVTAGSDGCVQTLGWESFSVKGKEHERSVITGRLAAEVMEDEGVTMYRGRKMWRPIME